MDGKNIRQKEAFRLRYDKFITYKHQKDERTHFNYIKKFFFETLEKKIEKIIYSFFGILPKVSSNTEIHKEKKESTLS